MNHREKSPSLLDLLTYLAAGAAAIALLARAAFSSLPPDDPLSDHSFVTQHPCAPPCWYGLQVGVSTALEVQATVDGLPFIMRGSGQQHTPVERWGRRVTDINWECRQPPVQGCVRAEISEGKLVGLSLLVGYVLTFDEVIRRLGLPDYVSLLSFPPNVAELTLWWREKGIGTTHRSGALWLLTDLRGGAKLQRGLKVSNLLYVDRFAAEAYARRCGDDCIPWPDFE